MIGLILTLVLIGLLLYIIETFIPMDPTIKQLIRIVVVVLVVLWLLALFGGVDIPIMRWPWPHVR